MKFLITFLSVLGLQSNCLALGPQVMSGKFRSNNELSLVEVHIWEKGDWASQEGIARRKELSNQGYGCFRRSPKQFACHLKTVDEKIPADVKEYVADYLRNFSIQFAGPFAEPKEMINTSTEREWWVEGQIIINQVNVRGFKWTHQYEPHNDLIVLPVNDEQPIPWFIYKSKERLNLPLQVQQKQGANVSKTYRLEAGLVLQ